MLNRIIIGVLALITLGSLTFAVVSATTKQNGGAEVRIAAKKLADGRVELGLQQREADGSWGERLLPSVRHLPASAQADLWLASSPVLLSGYLELPIESRIFSVGNSGQFSAGTHAFDLGHFMTEVIDDGVSSRPNLLSASLYFRCITPNPLTLPDGEDVRLSTYSGGLDLWVDDEYDGWPQRLQFQLSEEYSSLYLLARSFADDSGLGGADVDPTTVVAQKQWRLDDGEITHDMMLELKEYDTLLMGVYDFENRQIVVEFSLLLLDTPVQPNLDHCEEY